VILSRRRFFLGAAAVTAAVSMPLAKAIFPQETIEEILARRMAAAEAACIGAISREFYADGGQMSWGLASLIGESNPAEGIPDDWDEDEEPTYVRYEWKTVSASLNAV
jgi:hypothetical protein